VRYWIGGTSKGARLKTVDSIFHSHWYYRVCSCRTTGRERDGGERDVGPCFGLGIHGAPPHIYLSE